MKEGSIIAPGCLAFCELFIAAVKVSQIFAASGQRASHCQIYLKYIFLTSDEQHLRSNYKGFKKALIRLIISAYCFKSDEREFCETDIASEAF